MNPSEDAKLDDALSETFPASDPVARQSPLIVGAPAREEREEEEPAPPKPAFAIAGEPPEPHENHAVP